MAYTSKYSGAEIDQRLLQNYYDDIVASGYQGSKGEYLAALANLLKFNTTSIDAGNVTYGSTTVKNKLNKLDSEVIKTGSVVSTTPKAGNLNGGLRTRADVATMAAQDMSGKSLDVYYLKKKDLPNCGMLDLSHPRGDTLSGMEPRPDSTIVTYNTIAAAIRAVPSMYRRGGLEIKFVLTGSDTYKFMRLTKASWSNDPKYWEKC